MIFWVIAKRTSRYFFGLKEGQPDLFRDMHDSDIMRFKRKHKAINYFTNQFQGDKNMYYILKLESVDGQVRQAKITAKKKRLNKSR